MINRKPLEASLAAVKGFPKAKPKLGMILKPGLSEIARRSSNWGAAVCEDSGVGAAGGRPRRAAVWGKSAGIETFIFQGRRHYYEAWAGRRWLRRCSC